MARSRKELVEGVRHVEGWQPHLVGGRTVSLHGVDGDAEDAALLDGDRGRDLLGRLGSRQLLVLEQGDDRPGDERQRLTSRGPRTADGP